MVAEVAGSGVERSLAGTACGDDGGTGRLQEHEEEKRRRYGDAGARAAGPEPGGSDGAEHRIQRREIEQVELRLQAFEEGEVEDGGGGPGEDQTIAGVLPDLADGEAEDGTGQEDGERDGIEASAQGGPAGEAEVVQVAVNDLEFQGGERLRDVVLRPAMLPKNCA